MPQITLFTIVMAIALAVIIVLISIVKNPIIKSLIYGLPFPATLALIATQKDVDGTHVIGLFLLVVFLWSAHWFKKATTSVLLADGLATAIYVGLGYFLVNSLPEIKNQTALLSMFYVVLWLVFVLFYKSKPVQKKPPIQKMHVLKKGPLVFVLAIILLSFKEMLKGVVVLFPFSGIFTVVEMRDDLEVLASEFTKNSLSILSFLIIVYASATTIGFYPAIACGWIGCTITLKAVRMIRPTIA